MNTLIVGLGEVGAAHLRVLQSVYPCGGVDVDGVRGAIPDPVEIMHVAIRHSEDFESIVHGYMVQFSPRLVDILTTVPPGTCRALGPNVVHSTTRGLHPHLDDGLRTITKHVGGLMAFEVAAYFERAGIRCVTHPRAETTELAHLLNNIHYGVNLMWADEAAAICRAYGVDYYDVMRYTETHNAGFAALGLASKVRPVLTPPQGRIGGHCVVAAAGMIAPRHAGSLVTMLATYGEVKQERPIPIEQDLRSGNGAHQEA